MIRQPLEVSDWEYRAEGHANIILVHRTRPEVLRLRKRMIPSDGESAADQADEESAKQQCIDQLMYQNHVMRPLIGPNYVLHAELIPIPVGFVNEINRKWVGSRPAYRLIKEGDPSWNCGLLLPNVSALPSRCCGTASLPTPKLNGVTENTPNHADVSSCESQSTSSPDVRWNGVSMVVDSSQNGLISSASGCSQPMEDCSRSQPVASLCTSGVEENGDACHASTFCIELKPKWGFLPQPNQTQRGDGIKHTHCRFCLFQQLKVSEGKWICPSQYCPLDLFSGDRLRLRHALYSLLQTPQNNVRILKDGTQVFKADPNGMASENSWKCLLDSCEGCFAPPSAEDESYFKHLPETFKEKCSPSLRSLVDIIVNILMDDNNTPHHLFGHTAPPSLSNLPVCEASSFRNLARKGSFESRPAASKVGGVLNSVRVVQMLDSLDIEGLYPLWDGLNSRIGARPSLRQLWEIDGPYNSPCWADLSSSLGKVATPEKKSHTPEEEQAVNSQFLTPREEYAVRKLREFIAASTAKDCSVMVAFRAYSRGHKPSGPKTICVPSGDGNIHVDYRISVVDLDIKGFDRIFKYEHEDQAIIRHVQAKLSQ